MRMCFTKIISVIDDHERSTIISSTITIASTILVSLILRLSQFFEASDLALPQYCRKANKEIAIDVYCIDE